MPSEGTKRWLASTYVKCEDFPALEGYTVESGIAKFFGVKAQHNPQTRAQRIMEALSKKRDS